jgi:L-aminopeptidase/D-esterase-like protein
MGGRGAMKGGIGTASFALPSGWSVGAIAAVNAAGDIIDPETDRVVAGTRSADGKSLADVGS